MKYKVIAIDIDGTLVGKNGLISDEDKLAVMRMAYSGVRVVLCTGRVVQSTVPIIEELYLTATDHIFYDGAFTANPFSGYRKFAYTIENVLVCEAVEYSRQNNVHLRLHASKASFSLDHPFGPNWSEHLSSDLCFCECTGWPDTIYRDFFHMETTKVNFDDIVGNKGILKAEIIVHNDEEAMQIKQFKDHFGERFRYSIAHAPAFPDIDFINILHPQASKGIALNELMSDCGCPLAEVIAIGDGLNDISLLETAGVSVAMGNACDELKQVSDYITNTVEEHGVATAINFFFPV